MFMVLGESVYEVGRPHRHVLGLQGVPQAGDSFQWLPRLRVPRKSQAPANAEAAHADQDTKRGTKPSANRSKNCWWSSKPRAGLSAVLNRPYKRVDRRVKLQGVRSVSAPLLVGRFACLRTQRVLSSLPSWIQSVLMCARIRAAIWQSEAWTSFASITPVKKN